MTELQKTAAAYQHFTLEQWRILADLVARSGITASEKRDILTRMPSAALPQ